jgi:hypothetical protein
MPVIPVKKGGGPKRIIGKKWKAEHKGSLTPPPKKNPWVGYLLGRFGCGIGRFLNEQSGHPAQKPFVAQIMYIHVCIRLLYSASLSQSGLARFKSMDV